jgi:hypothetical protein
MGNKITRKFVLKNQSTINKGVFPDDKSIQKIIFLALRACLESYLKIS